MSKEFKRVMFRSANTRKEYERGRRNFNLGIALILTGVLLFGIATLVGCTEGDTYVSPTIPCCTDGCVDIHTPEVNPDCEKGDGGKVFIYICKDGKQKKIYEFNWPDWKKRGWKKGKCKPTPPPCPPPCPPGDDDDDDDDDDPVCYDDNPLCCPVKGKYAVCHFPPGNPENYHTIWVGSLSAVDAHIRNHDDYCGECRPR